MAGIEEVVVTAQKRQSSVQDAPMSISAIGGEDMAFRAVNNVTDLQSQIPGLNVSESGGASLISIRGVGTNVDTGATEPGVAVHIDGVYQPRPTTGPLGLSDLDRVEVLRGPQGTLYGRNSTGGVINFLLKRPTDTYESTLKLSVGSFEQRGAVGIVSGPLIQGTLDGRLVGEWDADGGFVKDETSGKESNGHHGYGGRAALAWMPAEDLTVDLSVLYRYDDGGGVTPRDVIRVPPQPNQELLGYFIPPGFTTRPDQSITGSTTKRKLNFLPYGERETTNGALTATWNLDALSLKSITGVQDHHFENVYDADFTSDDLTNFYGYRNRSKSFSEELTASGSSDSLQWLVGAFYFHEKFSPFLPVTIPKAVAGGLVPGSAGLMLELGSDETTRSVAAFTDLTYSLSESFRLIGGARILRDEKTADTTNQYFTSVAGIPIQLPNVPGVLTSCDDLHTSLTGKKFTPKLGAQYDITSSMMTYAQYTLGFKSGGSNFSSCGNTYEPEEVKSVEVGLKSRWFNRRLIANVSVFDSRYTNFQTLKINNLSASIVNAPKARVRGGDLELTALVAEPVLLTAAVSVLDAYYQKFCDTDSSKPAAQRVNDCPYEGGTGQDLKGVELSRAPDYTVNLGAEYSFETPADWVNRWRLRGEWFKSAPVVFRPFGGPEDGQKSYSLVNAYLSTNDVSGNLGLRLFVKNIMNTEYYLYSAADAAGRVYGPGGEPRRFGLEMTYHWF
ncbi:TonB-dependent receptor [Hydrocarboniphaga sp.]|uniref:TonB-dependent receptor n=1 Tax=Hydrocarboniphaga sp. TaxID=2033016 RepID=UPI00260C9151|nr:TonB-dependent receptor [Hydrocarboniphaga sp.]